MRALQKTGPFQKDKKYSFNITGAACHVGLEISGTKHGIEPIFKVNDIPFAVGETCVLEWDNVEMREITVTPIVDLDEYTIIDLAYE